MTARLLCVEDDATLRGVLARELEGFGYEVLAVGSGEEALERLEGFAPDLMLVDLRLPGLGGLAVVEAVVERTPGVQALVLTGHGTVSDAVVAMRLGAFDFLEKPIALDVLEQTLARALEHRRLREENVRLRSLVDRGAAARILGGAPATVELRALIEKIAASEASVLVEGENGTGKELVARAIHAAGPRAERPFVVVNCGAIAESLIESELFGHERGSFTGADSKRIGLFEAAHGGTLFLDEVGELPLAVQPVLLRALQFGEVRPVGAQATRRVDCRVIAATNRDLEQEREEGRFREDLYYRLATLVVPVPPLRARRSDVPELLATFLAAASAPADPPRVAEDALATLDGHDWPGNVRELENAAVRLCTLCDGETITKADVERFVLRSSRRAVIEDLPTLDVESLERLAIEQALARHDGNRTAAAAELGLAVKTLYNKIRRYGIEPPRR